MKKYGLILNNIGSPQSYEAKDVGAYLNEFLMDKYIINIPFIIRFFLVKLIIVPRRKWASAKKYKSVWGVKKSPLIELTEGLQIQLEQKLKETDRPYLIELGMRYGRPSIADALQKMKAEQIENVIFAPLYPQYAEATYLSAIEKFKMEAQKNYPELKFVNVLQPFYMSAYFINAFSSKLKKAMDTKKWQHVLFSFHGLPESQIKKNPACLVSANCCQRVEACTENCYRAQCFKTAHSIAEKVQLAPQDFSVTFQSRLGPAKWIRPYSSETVQIKAQEGIKNLLVLCPAFVTDCLETLEEVALELKAEFQHAGGENLELIPCLNHDDEWIEAFIKIINDQNNLKQIKLST